MKLLNPRGMMFAAAATFLLATASQVAVVMGHFRSGYIYYGSASRCAPLALGVLLALLGDRLPPCTHVKRQLLLGAGLASWLIASAWLIDQPGSLDGRMVIGRLLVSLGAGAILLAALHSRSRLVRAGWIVHLGKISFGLYMLHLIGVLISLKLMHSVGTWQVLAAKVAGLGVTVLLAIASYRWIESPFLRLKDRYATVQSRPV